LEQFVGFYILLKKKIPNKRWSLCSQLVIEAICNL